MALANTACLLAQQQASKSGKGVLVIDWDLEAPGLHEFFRNSFKHKTSANADAELKQRPGLIDLFIELDETTQKSGLTGHAQTQEMVDQVLKELDLNSFILETDRPCLSLLKAGRFDDTYASRVNCFQWEALHTRSPLLILSFAEHLSHQYEYVLIDSRTGLTDMSGVSTMLMPEKLVIVFTPNRQSIFGVNDLVQKATTYRNQSPDVRPLIVFPLASRIDISEPSLLEYWRFGFQRRQDFPKYEDTMDFPGYQPLFQKLFADVYDLKNCDLGAYFQEVQVQHVPYYAYGENIAVLRQPSGDRLSLTASYQKVVDWLVNHPVPWKQEAEQKGEARPDEPEKIAEAAFQRLTFEQRAAAQSLFTRLVRIADREDGMENTRQRVREDELTPDERDVLPALAEAHVINILEDGLKKERTVQAEQETIIRRWARLTNWIDNDRPFLLWRQSLRARIAENVADDDRKGAGLLSGRVLEVAKQYLSERPENLNDLEKEYINNSIVFERSRKTRQRIRNIAYAALILFALGFFILSWWKQQSSTNLTADAYVQLGRTYAERGDIKGAEEYFGRAIELDQKLVDAYYSRGIARYNAANNGGDPTLYQYALQDFDKAIELNSTHAAAHNGRGLVYQKLEDTDSAIVNYREAIRLNPALTDGYINLGNAYRIKGDFQSALETYQNVFQRNPNSAEAYNARGVLYSQLGDSDHAIEDFNRAIQFNKDFAEAYLNRGQVFAANGKLAIAIADYDIAVQLNSTAEAYFWRGNAYKLKGELPRAIENYRMAIDKKPDYYEAYLKLGDAYVETRNADEALRYYALAIKHNPTSAEAYFRLGLAHQIFNRDDDAIEAFNKAISHGLQDFEIYFQRGISFKKKANKGNAVADFQKAFALTPDEEQRSKARTQLRELGILLRTPVSETNLGLHYKNLADTDVVDAVRAELQRQGFKSNVVRPTDQTPEFPGSTRYFNSEDKENAEQVQKIVEQLILDKTQVKVNVPIVFYRSFARRKNVRLGEIEVWIPSLH